jgi:uncharacterized Zn finger protein (UPF0148 family)
MKDGTIPCPICGANLMIKLARGRKSGKPFVMLICPNDGRHIRAFINDKEFVGSVLSKLQNTQNSMRDGVDSHTEVTGVLQNKIGEGLENHE